VGHTRDDQAEQVLLGLIRGSGARSLSGMPRTRPLSNSAPGHTEVHVVRPFLSLPRDVTAQACLDAGLSTFQDPHNRDPHFTRATVRRLLADLETGLDRDLRGPLARTADLLRADTEALDEISDAAFERLGSPPWSVESVVAHPAAVRTRLWRRMALEAGVPGSDLGAVHLRAVDALVADWHGQGPVDLPGHRQVHRAEGAIWLRDRGRG